MLAISMDHHGQRHGDHPDRHESVGSGVGPDLRKGGEGQKQYRGNQAMDGASGGSETTDPVEAIGVVGPGAIVGRSGGRHLYPAILQSAQSP